MIAYSMHGMNSFVGVSLHACANPLPLPSPVPHLEGGLRMRDSLLFAKISNNVFFDSFPAVQLGHDVGFFIPHYNIIPPLPPNLLLAAIIPFSSAKVTFGRSSVLVNNTPAAMYRAFLPLLVCGDPVKLPLGFVLEDGFRNTVVFSLGAGDVAQGVARIIWENIKSVITKRLGGEALGKDLARHLKGPAGGRLTRWLAGKLPQKVWEQIVAQVPQNAWEELAKKAPQKLWDKVLKQITDAMLEDVASKSKLEPKKKSALKSPVEAIIRSIPVVGDPSAGATR
jgi:hypothetical protein